MSSRRRFSRGTSATQLANVWPPSRESGRSSLRRSQQRLQILTHSAVAESLPPELGLVPRQNSTGGKARLGGIGKRGDSYLRRLLVNSAHSVLLCSKAAKTDSWLMSLLGRKPRLVAAVALANKTARVTWPS